MATPPLILLDGTTAYASDVMALFNELYSNIAPNNVQPSNKIGTGRFVLESAIGTLGGNPVGTIIAHYDYGVISTLPDPAVWKICNGAMIVDASSPYNGKNLPDQSGRYLVGFGTDGGANIGMGALPDPPTPVGNAAHQINLQHQHGPGTLQFKVIKVLGGSIQGYDSGGTSQTLHNGRNVQALAGGPLCLEYAPAADGDYYTTQGAGSTDQQLSTTQSIQPRSIQCRFYLRYK